VANVYILGMPFLHQTDHVTPNKLMPLFQYAATGCMMISDNISPCFPWMSHQTDEDLHGEDADEDVRSPRRGAPFIFFRSMVDLTINGTSKMVYP
jgi:hypothetical protein